MPTVKLDRFDRDSHHAGIPAHNYAAVSGVRHGSRTDIVPRQLPPARRSWRSSAVMMAVGVGIAAGSYHSWKGPAENVVSAASESAEAARTVVVANPAPADTSTVVLPATLRPWQSATLYARIDGYLTGWHHDLGAHVRAGELLAEIGTPELDQEVVQGEALTREAVAAVQQAQAELEEAQADLKVAEAQRSRAQAEAALAKSQLQRRAKLLSRQAVSEEEYETAQRQVEARQAEMAAAESDVARRRANLTTRGATIESREATAKSRQANVDRLKELQRFNRIVAPFDGVITRRAAEVGMLVTAGKESLFVIEDTSRVRVQVNVPQAYATQAAPGAEIRVSLPESTGSSVPATITRIADAVDPSNRTMLAEIELDNSVHHFQPGSYVRVSLAASQNAAAWTIPTNTLAMKVGGPHVVLVNEQQQVEVRPVRLGRDLGARVVVTDGIRGNETLVVNPGDGLVEGAHVQVAQTTANGREALSP